MTLQATTGPVRRIARASSFSGADDMRLALEREYVALYRRPDLIVDVRQDGPLSRADLVAALHDLTA